MTDEQLFRALDLNRPGLEETRKLVEAGDLAAAKSAFVQHIKERTTPNSFVDWRAKPAPEARPKDPETRQADQALQRRYTVVGQALQFEGEIDWKANPTDPFDPEWTWQFGRFGWWSSLGRAYWDTGDEKYAQQFVWELQSWIQSNPMPDNVANAVGSRWRTIECGIRLAGSWPTAFFTFLSSPSFTDGDVIAMIKSMAEQAEYLHSYPTHGNWLTMEANGMGHVGVLFPEFTRAPVWRDDAIQRLYAELDVQVYPDGPQKELSTGYHYVALNNFLGLAKICALNTVAFPVDYIAKLERMWEAGMWAMMPDRGLPEVNDAWRTDVPRTLQEALTYFPGREDFRWIATEGQEGKAPDHLSHFFPWSGWAIMRSGWGTEDPYLFFDVGPFGMGHQHEDKLALVISAYGKNLLIDVGSYKYDRSAMRAYVLSPYAHNVVFVDGKGQHRRGRKELNINTQPQTTPWKSDAAFDFCEGSYEDGVGQENDLSVVHRRSILFVKPDYWLVLDRFEPSDDVEHVYEALFHLGTEEAEASGNKAMTLGDEANLEIQALGPDGIASEIVKGQETPYYLGWKGSHNAGGRHPIPVARYTWKAAGKNEVLYLFCPIRPGSESPVESFSQDGSGKKLKAEIVFRNGERHELRFGEGEWKVEKNPAPSL